MPAKKKATSHPVVKAPLARLGEDLAPPRRGEPLNIIIVKTNVVAGKIQFQIKAPKVVRAAPGSKVMLKHVYRLQEHSTDREEYRVLLRSALDGEAHAPSLARFGDNYAMPDDYSGFLVHEYKLPLKGTATLTFEVGAEYTVGSWKATEVESHEMKTGTGEIQILIG